MSSKFKYRPLPQIVFQGRFKLCNKFPNCRFEDTCTFAHGEDELKEWEDRSRMIKTENEGSLPNLNGFGTEWLCNTIGCNKRNIGTSICQKCGAQQSSRLAPRLQKTNAFSAQILSRLQANKIPESSLAELKGGVNLTPILCSPQSKGMDPNPCTTSCDHALRWRYRITCTTSQLLLQFGFLYPNKPEFALESACLKTSQNSKIEETELDGDGDYSPKAGIGRNPHDPSQARCCEFVVSFTPTRASESSHVQWVVFDFKSFLIGLPFRVTVEGGDASVDPQSQNSYFQDDDPKPVKPEGKYTISALGALMVEEETPRLQITCGEMLHRGLSLNPKDSDGTPLLHLALREGKLSSALLLIRHAEDDPSILHANDASGNTVVHAAAQAGLALALYALHSTLELANERSLLGSRNKEGQTPLHLAVHSRRETAVRALCELCPSSLNVKDNGGLTPLLTAIIHCKTSTITKILLGHGADITAADPSDMTPLHWAIRLGYNELSHTLVDIGAPLNVSAKDGTTPLHIAASNSNEPIIRLLLERGADVFTSDKSRRTALDIAHTQGHATCAGVLQRYFQRCRLCGKKKSLHVKLYKCSRCLNARYCSSQCQTTDWEKGHKHHCVST